MLLVALMATWLCALMATLFCALDWRLLFVCTYNIYCTVVIVKFSVARVCRVLLGVLWCGLWYDWGVRLRILLLFRLGDYDGKATGY